MIKDDNYVKILFRFYSNIFDKNMIETMWATIIDKSRGLYMLNNIPFYAPNIASDDIVFAEFDEQEQMLTYRSTESYSGNSIVQVVLIDKSKDINSIRKTFDKLGCTSEKLNESYFSMEIPMKVNYKSVKLILETMESKEIIGYAESCLSSNHRL